MIKAFLCDLMNKVTYLAIIEKTKDGFSAYFPDLPGCISIGDTLEKCIDNVNDALNLHYYGMQKTRKASRFLPIMIIFQKRRCKAILYV